MKQGAMAMETVLKFLVGVVVVVIIISGFMFMYGRLKGQTITFSDWITEQWGGLKPIKVFAEGGDVLERAEDCEDLTLAEIETLEKYHKRRYLEWLFCRGEEALKVGDNKDAKNHFENYLEECKKPDFEKHCMKVEEARDYIKKLEEREEVEEQILSELDLIESITKEFEALRGLPEEEQKIAYETFAEKYEPKISELSEEVQNSLMNLVNGAKIKVGILEVETRTCDEIKKMTNIQLGGYLEKIDRIREGTSKLDLIKEKVDCIRQNENANEQIKAEAYFILLILSVEKGTCDSALPYIQKISEDYKGLSFKHVENSYAVDEETGLLYEVSTTWTSSPILREARLVRAWCKFGEADYIRAFGVADSLKGNDNESKYRTSTRYKLYKESAFNLVSSAYTCGRRSEDDCNKQHNDFWISLDGKGKLVELEEPITKKEIKKYPKLGCYYSYHWMPNQCISCVFKSFYGGEVKSCSDYKTGILRSWPSTCVDDPCAINYPDGCEAVMNKAGLYQECEA